MRPNRSHILRMIGVLLIVFSSPTASFAANDNNNTTPQEVFDGMRTSFRKEKARGVHLRYLFHLSGPHGGDWWIDVADGTYTMGRGTIANPNVTFLASDRDWVALSNGTLGGTWAYLTGRLKIRGSSREARKLGEMFP